MPPLNSIKNKRLRGGASLGGHCVAPPNTQTHHLWHGRVNNNNNNPVSKSLQTLNYFGYLYSTNRHHNVI
jgi:hypothetical protein